MKDSTLWATFKMWWQRISLSGWSIKNQRTDLKWKNAWVIPSSGPLQSKTRNTDWVDFFLSVGGHSLSDICLSYYFGPESSISLHHSVQIFMIPRKCILIIGDRRTFHLAQTWIVTFGSGFLPNAIRIHPLGSMIIRSKFHGNRFNSLARNVLLMVAFEVKSGASRVCTNRTVNGSLNYAIESSMTNSNTVQMPVLDRAFPTLGPCIIL